MPIGEPILGEIWVERETGNFYAIEFGSTLDNIIFRRTGERDTMWLDRTRFLERFEPGPGVMPYVDPLPPLLPFWERLLEGS
jgi:hypothetical protein